MFLSRTGEGVGAVGIALSGGATLPLADDRQLWPALAPRASRSTAVRRLPVSRKAAPALGLRAEARVGTSQVLEETLSAAMTAAQAGDQDAFRSLLRACMPVAAAAARARGVRGEAVDDVVQETLLTIHRVRATYDPERPFLPWLRAIAQRRAVDALRREGRRPREAHDPVAYEAAPDVTPAPGTGIETSERHARLAKAVAALPAGQRQAVEQLSLREHSLAEASELTGRSKVALKVNLHRALKALRASLADARRDGDV